jgi:cyclopropane-fatty-acyl-phospholipid synthase
MTAQTIQQTIPASNAAINWVESGRVPDVLIRAGIRRLVRQRAIEINAGNCEKAADSMNRFVQKMNSSPVALVPELANEQHYEVPEAFFGHVLGKHRKYSSCFWSKDCTNLDEAEKHSLEITCNRAGIVDGMDVLDLGCGWGSLSLWIAQHYPACTVTSVSNSNSQRRYIESVARQRGLDNIRVLTCDMNDFDIESRFDRVVSVEMFEHMRNYDEMFRRISGWLSPGGRFFMHIFCHRNAPYVFEDNGPGDWMSRHFFSGGIMPSSDLPLRFQRNLALDRQWRWDGTHYQKTANAWLDLMDRNADAVKELFKQVYGPESSHQWVMRWRIFFMACAELFGIDKGQQWFVSHYLFSRQQDMVI